MVAVDLSFHDTCFHDTLQWRIVLQGKSPRPRKTGLPLGKLNGGDREIGGCTG